MAEQTIKVKYASVNSAIETKNLRRGTKLGDMADDLGIEVQSLRVNGEKASASYVVKNGDFIVAVDTEVAGA